VAAVGAEVREVVHFSSRLIQRQGGRRAAAAERGRAPLKMSGAKTITLSRFHVPPRPFGASHSSAGGRPGVNFLSLPVAKNPMKAASGDQKG